MTKLEQAARAAYDALTGIAAEMRPGARFKSWAELPADHQSMQIKAARAVLESLREPTEEMLEAAENAGPGPLIGWASTEPIPTRTPTDIWTAMLDAILKEGT